MNLTRGFASDNNAGIHPEIIKAIAEANMGHVVAYGDDIFTIRALSKFKEQFGQDSESFFVFNGTGANVLSLNSLARSFHGVICAEAAHINIDECGAPERFIGCKLLPVKTENGKLTVDMVRSQIRGKGDPHHIQARAISITQATEVGTVYREQEIKELSEFAHQNGMYLHMDGARLANAAAFLGRSLKQLTFDSGLDVLSFGGTKNGAMAAEAIVFFNKELCRDFIFFRKQAMQLASKMRFMAVQFERLFTDDLWLQNARHSNEMAQQLAFRLGKMSQIKILQKVEANGVFVRLPLKIIPQLLEKTFFYVLDEKKGDVRLMCSFDTTIADVNMLVEHVENLCKTLIL